MKFEVPAIAIEWNLFKMAVLDGQSLGTTTWRNLQPTNKDKARLLKVIFKSEIIHKSLNNNLRFVSFFNNIVQMIIN